MERRVRGMLFLLVLFAITMRFWLLSTLEKADLHKPSLKENSVRRWSEESSPSRLDGAADYLTIIVLANKRLGPLKRLLKSLRDADYGRDEGIKLHIRLEANQPREIVDFVVNYVWPHGEKLINSRIVQGGLIAAVVESWFPSDDNEFGLILEDDIEVSPLYYLWIKATLQWYREAGSPERIVGVSLYTPKTTETATFCPPQDRDCRRFDPQDLISRLVPRPNTPFLQQLPCSWGAVYFPRAWRQFARYMHFRVNGMDQHNATLLIPGSRTTGW